MKTTCFIPARYESTRLPGKPLLKILGISVINRVYLQVRQCKLINKIIVLTDDERIKEEVESINGDVEMITDECLNGTERIIEYIKGIDHDEYKIIVNLQGDEPFIKPDIVNLTINNYLEKNVECSTICFRTKDENEIKSKSRGKAVIDDFNNIIYCSRNVIPTNKKDNIIKDYNYNIHVGIFVYNKKYLLEEYVKSNTNLQLAEDIEWLKIIERGYKINTIFSEKMERGVDTIDDYNYLKNKYELS